MLEQELKELYIVQNLSTTQLAKQYGVATKTIRAWLRKYNISKDKTLINKNRQEARKKSNLEKYGVEHTSQLKANREKMKKTCIKRFGVDNGAKSEIIKEKIKQNNLEKYGETNPLKVEEIKEKIRLDQIRKKGFAYPFQQYKDSESVRILSTKENLQKYLNTFDHIPTIYELCEKLDYSHYALLNRIKELDLLDRVQYFPKGSWSQRLLPKDSIQIMTNRNKLKEFLESFKYKPTLHELADRLQYNRTTIGQKIQEYELQDYVKYGSTTSSYEKELKQIFLNKFQKDRKLLSPKYEIDLYSEEYRLGIEFNGNYWHSVDSKGRDYHQNKSLAAMDKNIRLIHIFEYEWLDSKKKDKLINQIENIVDDQRETIYARKCEIREVSTQEAKEFLNNYHLQDSDRSTIKFGLYYKSILVAIMTFCKPRFNKKYEWELSRLCFHPGFKIVGGAERLLRYFETQYKPKNLITYCDISKFTGEVYNRLSFKLKTLSSPNYVWCNNKGQIRTRYQCQRHKLVKQFPELEGLSETEIMTYLGYWKIEDAGNQVWIKIY